MFYIPVILGSIRRDRESAKVASFVVDYLGGMNGVATQLLDLKAMSLPMMEERLRFRKDAPPGIVQFSTQMKRANSIVIVTPEYNSGYPGVLKNALDYLKDEYKRKPFGIVTVSSSTLGGMLCLSSLREVVLHLGGVPIPAILPVSRVQELFLPDGTVTDPVFRRRAGAYFEELFWFTEALAVHRQKTTP